LIIGYGFMVGDGLPGLNYDVTIYVDAPMHGASRMHEPFQKLKGGRDVTVYVVNGCASQVTAIDLDSTVHDACMPSYSLSLRRWAAPPTTPNDTSMQDRLPTIAGEPTETRTLSASGHRCSKEIGIVPLHEFTSPWLHGEHDVTAFSNVYADCNDSPMTTCDGLTVYGTVGHGDITGFYAYRDLYDKKSGFRLHHGQRHRLLQSLQHVA
jgi:hypothetical protein